jgi:putative ABC transport system permease protein
MPVSVARTVVTDITQDQFSSIQVKVADHNSVGEIANTTEQRLLILRHVNSNTKDFTVTTAQAMQQRISSVMDTLDMFLTGIAAISLLVGAIGIANTMFTSVFRRKKEIGIMKALGARRKDIIGIFLLESVMLSLIGAALGAVFGAVVGYALNALYGLPFDIDAFVVIICVIIGVSVGVIAGILPARSAASIDAIEAMRG